MSIMIIIIITHTVLTTLNVCHNNHQFKYIILFNPQDTPYDMSIITPTLQIMEQRNRDVK